MARRLGVSPAYLSLIEKDKRAVQLPALFRALELHEAVGMEEFMQSLASVASTTGSRACSTSAPALAEPQ